MDQPMEMPISRRKGCKLQRTAVTLHHRLTQFIIISWPNPSENLTSNSNHPWQTPCAFETVQTNWGYTLEHMPIDVLWGDIFNTFRPWIVHFPLSIWVLSHTGSFSQSCFNRLLGLFLLSHMHVPSPSKKPTEMESLNWRNWLQYYKVVIEEIETIVFVFSQSQTWRN